jgi:hypothetical protein
MLAPPLLGASALPPRSGVKRVAAILFSLVALVGLCFASTHVEAGMALIASVRGRAADPCDTPLQPAVFMPKFRGGVTKMDGGELGSVMTTAGELNFADAGKALVWWYPKADTPG